jgi:hypothetical protein
MESTPFARGKEKAPEHMDMPPEPLIFFHPDYTVGTGISPVHAFRLADCTAGGESRPALKIYYAVII